MLREMEEAESAHPDTAKVIAERLEVARRELLDLGLRNPLLNYRLLRARGLEVVDEIPAEVFRLLVQEGRAMAFLPRMNGEKDGLMAQPQEDTTTESPAERHTDHRLQTDISSDELQSRLLATYYAANSFVQEQGVNILYMALGMLTWYESDSSQEPRRAPLMLVPVELTRSNVRDRFRLSHTDEDPGENLSLIEKANSDFPIDMPSLSETEIDSGNIDVDRYLQSVEEAVKDIPRWSVATNSIVLGLFSFSKFLMFRDLDVENWPEDDQPSDHPIINALLHQGFSEPEPRLDSEDDLESLARTRERLNAYSRAINTTVGDTGITPYRALGELSLLQQQYEQDPLPRVDVPAMAEWTRGEFQANVELVAELQTRVSSLGIPREHPFWGSRLTVLLPAHQEQLVLDVSAAQATLSRMTNAVGELAGTLGLEEPTGPTEAHAQALGAHRLLEAPDLQGVDVASPNWLYHRENLVGMVDAGAKLNALHREFDGVLQSGDWEQDAQEVRGVIDEHRGKWWRPLSREYRRARQRMASYYIQRPPSGLQAQVRMLDAILESQRQSDVFVAPLATGPRAIWTEVAARAVGLGSPCRNLAIPPGYPYRYQRGNLARRHPGIPVTGPSGRCRYSRKDHRRRRPEGARICSCGPGSIAGPRRRSPLWQGRPTGVPALPGTARDFCCVGEPDGEPPWHGGLQQHRRVLPRPGSRRGGGGGHKLAPGRWALD